MTYDTEASYESEMGELEAEPFRFEGEGEGGPAGGSPFNEMEEMELAAELVGVGNEAELDQFIGDLLKKAVSAVGGALRTPIGQQVGGLIKGAIKKVLPSVGAAVGGLVPGLGGALGSQLASQAGQLLGLELEGLSPEDKEFEAAKQLVRLAGDAAQTAATTNTPPALAVAQAAERHAPGLVRKGDASEPHGHPSGHSCGCGRTGTGRWLRRGNKIILVGV
jgi:hypothetical protein